MVKFINSWTQGIIIAVIVCTIIEMLLPEGKNKKYIRAIIGIYIVFNIISPIINNKKNMSLNFDLGNNYNNVIITSTTIDTNKYVESIFVEKIKDEICNSLKDKNYNVENIKIEIETENEKKYGSIISIALRVSKLQEQTESSICINKVVIGDKERIDDNSQLSQEDRENIKDFLSNNYGIDKKEIEVR